MFRSGQLALLRTLLIPAGLAMGIGLCGYRQHEEWGDYLLGVGIFCTTGLVLLLEKQGW
jgi:hypothetical protein